MQVGRYCRICKRLILSPPLLGGAVLYGCDFTNRNARQKAGTHRDLYAPKRIFSRNTTSKIHSRRQPCCGFLSCLAEKSLFLECFAVLRERFFHSKDLRGRRNTGCISRTMDTLCGKRFRQNRVNPYAHPPKAVGFFFTVHPRAFSGELQAGSAWEPGPFLSAHHRRRHRLLSPGGGSKRPRRRARSDRQNKSPEMPHPHS